MKQESRKWSFGRDDLSDYMHRWIIRTPWFTIRLHKILRSDAGRDFHDHPFKFTSRILSGGYIEHVPGCKCIFRGGVFFAYGWATPCDTFSAGDVVKRNATAFHRLELLTDTPTWTLVFTSGYFREWGFLLPSGAWARHDVYKTYKRISACERTSP